MSVTSNWLVRVNIGGTWYTATDDNGRDIRCGGRTGFKRACKRAMQEGEAMRWAHMTAVVREEDAEIPMFHRLAENCFEL